MFEIERMARDIVFVNGEYYIVDTCKPWDTKKWETGLRKVDHKKMFEDWLNEGETPPTPAEIMEYADDYDPYGWWDIEVHPNKRTARKRHKEICQTAVLNP